MKRKKTRQDADRKENYYCEYPDGWTDQSIILQSALKATNYKKINFIQG